MENCSIYSHHIWHKEIINTIINLVPKEIIEITGENDSWKSIVIFGQKNSLKSENKMTLTSEVREFPNFELDESVDEITTKLNVLRNYFGTIKDCDQQLLKKLIYKISSINMEIGVVVDKGFNAEFEKIVLAITEKLNGFIFSNNNSIFVAPNSENGIFNENGDVILSSSGYSDVDDLNVIIEPRYSTNGEIFEKNILK